MPLQAGDIYAPSDIPRRMGVTLGTADLTATSGSTEKTVDSITVSVVAGSTYSIRYTYHYAWASGAMGDDYIIRIRQGGLAGTQLTYGSGDIVNAVGALHTRYVETDWVASSTGSQTFTTTVARSSGAGTMTMRGSASQPRKLEVRFEE